MPPFLSKYGGDALWALMVFVGFCFLLLKKHPKVARFYQLNHEHGTLRVERDDDRIQAAMDLCSDYVLKTDHSLKGPELWKLYMTLLRAEQGFSALKGALVGGPTSTSWKGGWKDISSSASWPITSCVGWGIGSRKAATCGTGKPCAGSCAPTAWCPPACHLRTVGHRDPQAESAGYRTSAGLPKPRHRLEASLPRQKIRHEMNPE